MQDGGGLPAESQWWKYLYSSVVLLFCLVICIIGGAMFARTSAFILLVSIYVVRTKEMLRNIRNFMISVSSATDRGDRW